MELVERYVQAVEYYLPEGKKSDISRELRANIMDEIEAEQNDKARDLDTSEVSSLLTRQGHPQKVAQAYSPMSPLVASEDMLLYRSVMIKALIFLFAYAILTAGSYLLKEQSVNAFAYLFVALNSFIDNIGWVLIVVTASFYFAGKSGYLNKWRYPKWSPDSLPKANALIISTSDSVSEIATSVFALMMFWTPIWMDPISYDKLILGFAPDMQQWRVLLSVLVAYSLLSAVYRINKRYWTKTSLAAYIAEYLVYIGVMLYLWTQPALVVVHNPQASDLNRIIEGLFTNGWLFAAFIFTLITISLVRKWFKL